MADATVAAKQPPRQQLRYYRVDDLLLDPRNPRLVMPTASPSQEDLLARLYEQEGLDELAPSFAENGYFTEEPLVVARDDSGALIVIEGNRRLATLKLLLEPTLRTKLRVTNWPELTTEGREALQVVPCVEYAQREDVYPFLGFRHITGAKKWAPFQKARFIAELIDSGRGLAEIEDLIGDTTQTVKKLYQDYLVFRQATEDAGASPKLLRDRFSLLEVVLGQRSIKKHLGMPRRLPTESTDELIPESRLEALEEVISWVFGTDELAAVISDSREISSRLAPVLTSDEATDILRKTRDLTMAFEYSGGEKDYLLKRIQAAERVLRDVTGLIAVYERDPDVLSAAARLAKLMAGIERITALNE